MLILPDDPLGKRATMPVRRYESVRAVLLEHQITRSDGSWKCSCGLHRAASKTGKLQAPEEHLAALVARISTELSSDDEQVLRQAAAQALREAADAVYTYDNPPPNMSVLQKIAWFTKLDYAIDREKIANWLRERAEKVERGD